MRHDAKRLTHAGLRCIIGKNYPDTIIADRICHGDAAPIAADQQPGMGPRGESLDRPGVLQMN